MVEALNGMYVSAVSPHRINPHVWAEGASTMPANRRRGMRCDDRTLGNWTSLHPFGGVPPTVPSLIGALLLN